MSRTMTAQPKQDPLAQRDTITFAELGDGVVVIRIVGRGSFANSVEFKQLTDRLADAAGSKPYRFIVDMEQVTTLDSTFMGALAGAGLRHKRDTGEQMTLCNVNEQCCRLLETVGIKHFVQVRACPTEAAPAQTVEFREADRAEISRADQIIHMIEAHENLVTIDNENQARFESVLKYLRESLERENQKKG
ncbi:MAG: STAS domain-containing protein [Candidatus Sumerlaeaceae bacterium]|nr:STAS domain-containing protein [Candidatus Sumerlaeaceae bacterium]